MPCRSCANQSLHSIFSLGSTPLANRLLKESELQNMEAQYPLEIMLCEACGLVQLKEIVPPEELFSEYLYFTSNSDTMLKSVKELAESIIQTLPADATIIEIASNDGYLLQNYINKGFRVLGIEPAKNIAKFANEKGIRTRSEFFSRTSAERLLAEGYAADVIHAHNVMAHVPDINDFVAGLKKLLKPHGQIIIEVPYLLDLLKSTAFDTIYHEHVFYFALLPLQTIFTRHGLMIFDFEKRDIHGGSLRLFVAHVNQRDIEQRVIATLALETELGIKSPHFYHHFPLQINSLKKELHEKLFLLKTQNKKIAAYGASAKGATLLNFFGIGKESLDFVVDRSRTKQGYYTPGTHLPILPTEFLVKEKVDYTLLLTWNFVDEILKQQKEYRENGGKFIVFVPKLEII